MMTSPLLGLKLWKAWLLALFLSRLQGVTWPGVFQHWLSPRAPQPVSSPAVHLDFRWSYGCSGWTCGPVQALGLSAVGALMRSWREPRHRQTSSSLCSRPAG